MKSKYTEQLERLNARLAVREQDHDVTSLLDAGMENSFSLNPTRTALKKIRKRVC